MPAATYLCRCTAQHAQPSLTVTFAGGDVFGMIHLCPDCAVEFGHFMHNEQAIPTYHHMEWETVLDDFDNIDVDPEWIDEPDEDVAVDLGLERRVS